MSRRGVTVSSRGRAAAPSAAVNWPVCAAHDARDGRGRAASRRRRGSGSSAAIRASISRIGQAAAKDDRLRVEQVFEHRDHRRQIVGGLVDPGQQDGMALDRAGVDLGQAARRDAGLGKALPQRIAARHSAPGSRRCRRRSGRPRGTTHDMADFAGIAEGAAKGPPFDDDAEPKADAEIDEAEIAQMRARRHRAARRRRRRWRRFRRRRCIAGRAEQVAAASTPGPAGQGRRARPNSCPRSRTGRA